MSILDTIKGAINESKEGGNALFGSDKDKGTTEAAVERSKRSGSAASAKPKREKAGTVREASKPSNKELTKEEKKAQRAKEREAEDLRATVTQILLAKDEDYQRTEKIWWALIGGGFVCTLISAVINYGPAATDTTGTWAIIGMILIALAYVLIIGSFIYGLFTRNKKRKPIEARVDKMTEKKMWQIVDKDNEERAAKKAAKEAAKAAKKAEKEAKKAAKNADKAAEEE